MKGNLRSGQLKLVRRFTDAARQTFRDSQVDTIPPSSCSGHGPKFIKIHQNPLGGGQRAYCHGIFLQTYNKGTDVTDVHGLRGMSLPSHLPLSFHIKSLSSLECVGQDNHW